MKHLDVKVKLPFLWGKAVFKKSEWPQINLIVGPNGSGKTLLAQEISRHFEAAGKKVRFLQTEKESPELAIEVLRSDERIRGKVETVLSSMFGKTIQFLDDIDGTFIPVVTNKAWNVQYDLNSVECHGLKEIIVLLVNLYNNSNDLLILDEPELHLHPQFQQFFMNEIRKVAARHQKRMFFIISHSPYFIDLRFSDDLLGVIACHINSEPTHIDFLSEQDDDLFRRFLPRFNTYHKQFFFSDNQIFVEGYTDQQMFTNLLPFIEDEYKAAGTGIIDVGGKDELGVFCKVCSLLGTNGRIITDLDSLFSGKLRDVFCKDERVVQWLSKQEERQKSFYESIFTPKELGSKNGLEKTVTLEKLIFRLERYLTAIGKEILSKKGKPPKKLALYIEKLEALKAKHVNAESVDTFKTVILQGIINFPDELEKYLSSSTAKSLPEIKNLYSLVLAAAEAARVYILPKGCIEHYYVKNEVQFMPVPGKDRLFHAELEHITTASSKVVRRDYAELIGILEKALQRL
ncbi:MAG: AAA family ATPase [Treponema sp.]|nr:AAA family ATPase [Treponema sp.]